MKRIFNQSNLFFLGNSASVSAAAVVAVVASDIVVDAFVVVVTVVVAAAVVVVDAFVVVVAVAVVVSVDNVFLEKLIFWVDLSSIYKQPIRPEGDHITKIFLLQVGSSR